MKYIIIKLLFSLYTVCSIYTWVISSVITVGRLVFRGSTTSTCLCTNESLVPAHVGTAQ